MRVYLSLQRLDGRLLFLQLHGVNLIYQAVNLLRHAVKRLAEIAHLIPCLDLHPDGVVAFLHPD